MRLLYRSEDWFEAWQFPEWLKPAVGGLMVGRHPALLPRGLRCRASRPWRPRSGCDSPGAFSIGLFFAELLGNIFTLGSGGSGGVFAPSLYMGAMLGGAYGMGVHALFPEMTGGSGAYAMVGMAAFFAAAAKAPTTSILILFEMTNDYRIILPLMVATVGSVTLANRFMPLSIYTLKLHNRGITFPYEDGAERSRGRSRPPSPSLPPTRTKTRSGPGRVLTSARRGLSRCSAGRRRCR